MADWGRYRDKAWDFEPWAASVGVDLLLLQARASDPQSQPSWVNRRVEQVEFLDTRAVRWRLSIDFNIPESAPRVQLGSEEFCLVPIAKLAKANITSFSMRDEQSAAVWMPTSWETARYVVPALIKGAAQIINRTPQELAPVLGQELEWIVSGDPREFRSKAPALLAAATWIDANRNFDHALCEYHRTQTQCEETRLSRGRLWYERQLEYEQAQRELGDATQAKEQAAHEWRGVKEDIQPLAQQLMADKYFRYLVEEFAQNFVVVFAAKSTAGTRRVIKLAYESYGPRREVAGGSLHRFLQSLGWRLWQIDVLIGGRGGSYHLEVAAPSGVDVVGIAANRLERREPGQHIGWWRRFKTWRRSLIFWEPNVDVSVPGYLPHVHINPPDGATVRYRAAIFVRVSRPGWLTFSWLVTIVIAAAMVASNVGLATVYSAPTARAAATQAGTIATLLLTLLGVIATVSVRPHALASRLLILARLLILIDVATVLVGTGVLALHQASHAPSTLWTVLTSITVAVAAMLTLSWLLPVARIHRRQKS